MLPLKKAPALSYLYWVYTMIQNISPIPWTTNRKDFQRNTKDIIPWHLCLLVRGHAIVLVCTSSCHNISFLFVLKKFRFIVAQRMGVVNVKVALAKILANFNIEAMKRKEVEYKFHTAPVLIPIDGLRVSLSKRW